MKFLFAAAVSPRELYVCCDAYSEPLRDPTAYLLDGREGLVASAQAAKEPGGRAKVILGMKSELKIGRPIEIGMKGEESVVCVYPSSAYSRFWFLDVEGLPQTPESGSIFAAEGARVVIDSRYFRGSGAIASASSRLDPLSGDVSTETLVLRLADVDNRLGQLFATDLPDGSAREFSLAKAVSADADAFYVSGREAARRIAPGSHIYVGREAALVLSCSESEGCDAEALVERGRLGTAASSHSAQTPVYLENRLLEGRLAVLYVCESPDYAPKVAFKGTIEAVEPSSDGLGFDMKISDMLSAYDKPLSAMFATAHYLDFNLKKIINDGRGNDSRDYFAVTAHSEKPPAGAWSDDYEWASGRWFKHFNDSDFYFGKTNGLGAKTVIPLARFRSPEGVSLECGDMPYYETPRGFDEIHNDDAPSSRGYSTLGAPFAYLMCSPRPQIFKAVSAGRRYIRRYGLLNPSRFAVSDLRSLEDWLRRGAIFEAGIYDVLLGEFLPHSLVLPQGEYADVGDAAAAYSNMQIASPEKAKIETMSEVLPLARIYGGMSPFQAAGLLLTGFLGSDRLLAPKYCADLPTRDLYVYSGGLDGAESALCADGVLATGCGDTLIKTIQKELLGPVCGYLTVSRTGRIIISGLNAADYEHRPVVSRADLASISASFERAAPAVGKIRYKFGYDPYAGKFAYETIVDAPESGGKEKTFELKLLCCAGFERADKSVVGALARSAALWLSKFGKAQYACSFEIIDKEEFRDLCPGMWVKLAGLPLGTNRFGQKEICGDGLIVDCKYLFDQGKIELKTLIFPRDEGAKNAGKRKAALAFGAPAIRIEDDGGTTRIYFKTGPSGEVGELGESGAPYGLEIFADKLPRLKAADLKRGEENLAEKITVCGWGAAVLGGETAVFAETQSGAVPWTSRVCGVDETLETAKIEGDATGRFAPGDLVRYGGSGAQARLEKVEYDEAADETALTWSFGENPPSEGDALWNAENLFEVDDYSEAPCEEIRDCNVYMDDGRWRAPGHAVFEGLYEAYPSAVISVADDCRGEFNGCKELIVWAAEEKSNESVFYPEVESVSYDVDLKQTVLRLKGEMPGCPASAKLRRSERGEIWIEPEPGASVDGSEDCFYKFS